VLGTGATASDIVVIVVYDVFSVADTVSKTDGGQFDNSITITTADNSVNLNLVSTDADANSGPELELYRNSASPADNDFVGTISFKAENDAGEKIEYGVLNTRIVDASDGTEDFRMEFQGKVGGSDVSLLKMDNGNIVVNEDSQDIDFRVESNSNANMFFVDAGNDKIGINTNAPNRMLGIENGDVQIHETGSSDPLLQFSVGNTQASPTQSFSLRIDNSDSDKFQLVNGTTGAIPLTVDTSDKVGIGITSPDGTLHVHSASAGSVTANTDADELVVENSGNGGVSILTPDSNRSAIFLGHASDNLKLQIRHDGATSLGQIISDDALTFNVGDGSERMRIDSSGNLLFNLTNRLFADASNTFNASVVDNSVLRVNRAGSDGTIIDIGKDGTAIGFLGATSGDLFIGTGDVGIRFSDASDSIFAVSGTAGRDNAVDVGNASFRFDDVRATNGTIQTSDRNDKQDIEELSDAEKRVAVVAKGLMRKYRWKDKVAEKGDKARTHFGIIAQDLEDAFKAEGLDASKYAMFCSDTWTNDDGKEQTRLGIRYPQLLAFIISAI